MESELETPCGAKVFMNKDLAAASTAVSELAALAQICQKVVGLSDSLRNLLPLGKFISMLAKP